jgi:hypothetical protein
MKYLAYLNILFGDNHVQNSGNCKKGDALRTTLVLKIGLKKFLTINVTLKNRHIYIIAPNFTNFYRQIFKIFKFMFFVDGTQKKIKLSRKVITHPSFASFFICEIKNN